MWGCRRSGGGVLAHGRDLRRRGFIRSYRAGQVQAKINLKATISHRDRAVRRQYNDRLSQQAPLNAVCRSQKYFYDLSSAPT